jgi:large subunit ribosomal protein L25
MATVNLSARRRQDFANSLLKQNRKKGNVPGIFYQRESEPVAIYVRETALNPFIYTSEVNLISLTIEGEAKPYTCILKDIQFDPVSDKAIHFDLLGISENEKIKVEVPFQLSGSAVGVRDGGILQQVMHSVEVECFPNDIPSHIEIDITKLKIGDSIHLSDIVQDKFKILGSLDSTIVSVVPPAVEKAEIPAEGEETTASSEPEVISKGKKDEETQEK